MRPKTVEIIK